MRAAVRDGQKGAASRGGENRQRVLGQREQTAKRTAPRELLGAQMLRTPR